MADVELAPGNSLETAPPEEGRQLAATMARPVFTLTQPGSEACGQQREIWANDPASLIALGQTATIDSATMAAANDRWR